MAIEAAMALTNRLLSQAQALAAMTAYLQMATANETPEAALEAAVGKVVDSLDARALLDGLTDKERRVVHALARSYLHQALELADNPFRPNAWSHSDPTVLQAQGAASAVVARLIHEAGLCGPGARILDVGTGVAGLAIAFCQTFADATVTGVDPWEPALVLARRNIEQAGLQSRIDLHAVTIEEYEDGEGFDLVWLPSFFIPPAAIDVSLARIRRLLRPGGSLVMGILSSSDDPLAAAVDAMVTVRSGGTLLQAGDAAAKLADAGFGQVGEVSRTWQVPLQLITGRSA